MSHEVFRAHDLRVRLGKNEVLRGADLVLEPGKVTVLLGENGAGKTTLLRLALGLIRPSGGSLRVFGHNPCRHARAVRERIGFVPAEPDAPKWMTLDDLCRFLRPQYPRWDDTVVDTLCAQLRVPRDRDFKAMSRGEGMKAMLVAALAPRPDLLLLDEPFAGMDPLARDEVLTGVLDALRDDERTVLCTTHDLDAAARIADHVAVLANGSVTRTGTVSEFTNENQVGASEALRAAVVAQIRASAAREVQSCR